MRINNRQLIQTITGASFTLALSAVCIMMFRGPISIVSTFLIPPIIVLFSNRYISLYHILTSMGLVLMTMIFFPTQLVFVFTYILLALVLDNITKKGGRFPPFNKIIIYISLTITTLFIGIRLTQLIYMIPLHTMMLRISRNNFFFYFAILFVEGLIVSMFNFGILKVFRKRVYRN